MIWYAVVNDLVGGWAVANSSRPLSEHGQGVIREAVIADGITTEEEAQLIARLLNEHEARPDYPTPRIEIRRDSEFGNWQAFMYDDEGKILAFGGAFYLAAAVVAMTENLMARAVEERWLTEPPRDATLPPTT